MIREFHDEITRLRAELEKYGGAGANMGGGNQPKLDANGDLVVEKVVYFKDKEKMAQMEQEIEKEINQVKNTFEKQKDLIRQQTQIDE